MTEYMRENRRRQRLLQELMALVPPARRDDPVYRRAECEARGALVNLVQLIYHDRPCEGHYRDYEFSAASMRSHWQGGIDDLRRSLAQPGWLDLPSPEHPFVTHDVHQA
jgi:NTE family protein